MSGRSRVSSSQTMSEVLKTLNSAQRAAVTSPADVLQILAPPGSGKTKTLTTRVAYLLSHNGFKPWNIIVATFTVKAAREMKERIGVLVGDGLESKLILGTFHSIARRYLVRYGHLIGIRKGFGIADSNDSMGIIKRIIKSRKMRLDNYSSRNRISSLKAKGTTHALFLASLKPGQSGSANEEFATLYAEYEEELLKVNTLDYDDLLLRAIDLLRAHPTCVSNVEAVLIDEFQDTNLVQFDLMRLFAARRERVTVVGDPDQSIYSFRSAEIENLQRMKRQYPETVVLNLEENYRSSGAILLSALAVIQQDTSRPDRPLLPTHCVGTVPVLRTLHSASAEAEWIVSEIKRSIAMSGNILLTFDDYAILIRSAFLSRSIESALSTAGITYKVHGGHRFYDHPEIKLLLDYLRAINFPDNNDVLARIINTPSRRIGEKTVKGLLGEADQKRTSLFKLVRNVVSGHATSSTKLSKAVVNALGCFHELISSSREKLAAEDEPCSLLDLVEGLMSKLSYRDYLKKTYPEEHDHENRLANLDELLAQITEISRDPTEILALEDLPSIDGLFQDSSPSPSERLLSCFLSNTALTSDPSTSATVASVESSPPKAQVTISTIHAAKGLEWPVVFIPSVYQGSIPHSRAENTDEERRLLYVAMTRAQALLYMSAPSTTSQGDSAPLSEFLTCKIIAPHIVKLGPSLSHSVIRSISDILRRPCPSEKVIHQASQALDSTEDDQFPLDGSAKTYRRRNWSEANRSTWKRDKRIPPPKVWSSADSFDCTKPLTGPPTHIDIIQRPVQPDSRTQAIEAIDLSQLPSAAWQSNYTGLNNAVWPPKRPRLDSNAAHPLPLAASMSPQAAAVTFPTTMHQPNLFSTANTTMTQAPSFVSAKTHLRDLGDSQRTADDDALRRRAKPDGKKVHSKSATMSPAPSGKENEIPASGLHRFFCKRTADGEMKTNCL